ncbi:type II restriction endonuclease [Mucilaginibacter robiniae]|uniref:site-specific DNA-methyltransferase (adenine-specific) n=1 Tax=Mucilaginibacter robiniae TaxID=2728022 RepID=A0A7L5DVG8_9SPHI|nr:TaqI-like C-terminal specificity domain-containing protein [Mucilaginibacter robiniae]QJD94721.1 type II restriction endonuclease [Mucilaginibacter robiniae]
MHLKLITPKQALNKAYLKEKISRTSIELFKTNFVDLLSKINEKGDEEHLKSLIADFLKFTWYKDAYQINPISKNDLVIHTGKSPADPIGVILEAKNMVNTLEMISEQKPNVKAIHELILYYLNERITNNKHDVKQLVATNIYEWYVFDANEFDKKIYRSTAIKKLYEQKRNDNKDNPWFYGELKKLLADDELSLEATYFDIRTYKQAALSNNADNDKKLIPLFKILSPVHLLKLSFANDSNTLQPKFYSELLHIIGLYEYKEGSKKLISRKKEGERNAGSLLENAIANLDSHDKISRLDKPSQYGDNYQNRMYNVALELVITWVNRILFLKLLEAQLLNYHKGDKGFTFLNKDKIHSFDDLDKLFFRVLAKKEEERSQEVLRLFGKVPYLNSSLFEPTELEHQTLFINGLEDAIALPLISSTVLKDQRGRTIKGSLNTLDYLFEFLNAYDFSSEGAEEIQEDNKTLINASVLGLIFEKINGYKDGSFFTPGFITMYMCRETIRRAVVQKFNEVKGWKLQEYTDIYDRITNLTDRKEANDIINSLKICDPAVGSGHFLVSALNELIAIKSDLNILMSSDGRTLRDYHIEVVNDELIVNDENGDSFKYNFHDHRSQIVQQTLFHEKQTIIEQCLFGVDINPNSVKICRLRLWIELLKNAYYKPASGGGLQLETLPNIDINIKTGNSLISRFALDADLKPALKKNNITIEAYRQAVDTYRNARDKEQKREMEGIISVIKTNFRTEISNNSKEVKDLTKLESEYVYKYDSTQLFDNKLSKKQINDKKDLKNKIDKLKTRIEEIKTNKIYENAFEWRFEFPEVLGDDSSYRGFDVVIGNPPYGIKFQLNEINFFKAYYSSFEYQVNSYVLFFENALSLLKVNGLVDFITPATFTYQRYFKRIRSILKSNKILRVRKFLYEVFEDADIGDSVSLLTKKETISSTYPIEVQFLFKSKEIQKSILSENFYLSENVFDLNYSAMNISLSHPNSIYLGDISKIIVGIKPYQVGKGKPKQVKEVVDNKIYTSTIKLDDDYRLCINGKDFHRYGLINKPTMFLKYGEWLAEPRKSAFFDEEKIILRQTSDSIIAMLDSSKSLNLNNVYNIGHIDAKYKYKYVLGLINSSLINYIYQNISQDKGRSFAEVKKVYLEKLPIIKATNRQQNDLSMIVDEIILKKESDINYDISHLEKQINQFVYELYNLTEEEIKIVEEAI